MPTESYFVDVTGMKPYIVHYNMDGREYECEIRAQSWEDADRRLKQIGSNGRVYGKKVFALSINLPAFIARPLMSLLGVKAR